MKKLLLLALLATSIITCKKPEIVDPEPPVKKEINLITLSAVPGEIVHAEATYDLPTDPARINVGDSSVAIAVYEGTKLAFVLPVLPEGTVIIDFAGIGSQTQSNLTVGSYQPITNPDVTLNEFTTEVEKSIENLRPYVSSTIINLDPKHLELLEYFNKTLKDNFNLLTEAEKIQTAYYLRANKPDGDLLLNDTLNKEFYMGKSDYFYNPGASLVVCTKRFVGYSIAAVIAFDLGWPITLFPAPEPVSKVMAAGLMTTGFVAAITAIQYGVRAARLTGIPDKIMEVMGKRAGELLLTNDKEKDVTFSGAYRNLNQSDAGSSNPIISDFFKKLASFQAGYNKGVEIANKVISWFPWSSPQVPSWTNPIGTQSSTQELNLPGTGLKLSDVSNSAIKVIYTPNTQGLAIKATSTTITGETPFTFKVTFIDPDLGIVITKQVDAIFVSITYTTSIVSGDNQTAFYGEALPKPLVVKVIGSDGKPLQGAKVEWINYKGDGQFSPSTTSTNSQGLASTTYTLDKTEQFPIMKVYVTDNAKNQIPGSPLVFMATAREFDSTAIYASSALGKYTVSGFVGNGPNSRLYCEVKAGGTARYTIYDDPSWPDGTGWNQYWNIVKYNGRYYYLDNWYNGVTDVAKDHPLTYPVSSFQYHSNTTYTK